MRRHNHNRKVLCFDVCYESLWHGHEVSSNTHQILSTLLNQLCCASLNFTWLTKHLHSSAVLDDQQNVRPIKELLQTLYASLCSLVQDMGKSVLVGNINIWVHRMENILQWQQQLDNIQINRVSEWVFLKESSIQI